jgi:hypothetical protein
MKCESCQGTGDGLKTGDGNCSECNGSGTVCDVCGDPAETGQTMCEDGLLEEAEGEMK